MSNQENTNSSNKSKLFKSGSYSLISTLVLIGIVIAINIFTHFIPTKYTQFDTSYNKLYSITDETKAIIGNLSNDITIYWIARESYKDDSVELLLNEYKTYSNKITIKEVDPELNPSFGKKYTDSLQDNSIIVEAGDRFKYLGYNDLFETDYSNYYTTGDTETSFAGESSITSAIDYCINPDIPNIYALTGHEEFSIPQNALDALQKQNINYKEFNLITEGSVPEDADALMICSPKRDISTDEEELLKSYLQKGGNIILLQDSIDNNTNKLDLPNLKDLLSYYGINLVDGFVIENDPSYCAFETPYYLLPKVESNAITSTITDKNLYILLPLAQGATIGTDLRENLNVSQLLTSSVSAFSRVNVTDESSLEKQSSDIDGPFALGAIATENISDGITSRLVWYGSSTILDESVNNMVAGGDIELFVSTVNSLIDTTGNKINIPTKSLSGESLTINSSTSNLLKIILVLIIPFGYLGYGISVVVKRKNK